MAKGGSQFKISCLCLFGCVVLYFYFWLYQPPNEMKKAVFATNVGGYFCIVYHKQLPHNTQQVSLFSFLSLFISDSQTVVCMTVSYSLFFSLTFHGIFFCKLISHTKKTLTLFVTDHSVWIYKYMYVYSKYRHLKQMQPFTPCITHSKILRNFVCHITLIHATVIVNISDRHIRFVNCYKS